MHDDVDVVICNVNVLFGEVYRVGKELFGDGRVEVFDIKYGEGVLIFVLYAGEPVNYRRRVFPLIKSSFLSESGVDVFEDLFADSSDFAFCWVNESACGLVLEVVFVVFKRYECLPFCHTFCAVVDVEVSSNVFGFVVNVNDSIIVRFLVRRCYVISE